MRLYSLWGFAQKYSKKIDPLAENTEHGIGIHLTCLYTFCTHAVWESKHYTLIKMLHCYNSKWFNKKVLILWTPHGSIGDTSLDCMYGTAQARQLHLTENT